MMEQHPQRNFMPGDQWVYYKIYTGTKTSDRLLANEILPLTEGLLKQGSIAQWFFIRYADPDWHLRLRFKLSSPQGLGFVVEQTTAMLKPYVAQDMVWKVQLDTYQRELERYGPATMELSEALFFHESRMVAQFLDLIDGPDGEEIRWLFGLRAIDAFLDTFALDTPQKQILIEGLRTLFGKEFNMGRPLKKQLDARYRAHRTKIEEFMAFAPGELPDYDVLLTLLDGWCQAITPVTKQVLAIYNEKELKPTLESLLASYLHMLIDRLFRSGNRMHELVCYDFLARHYKSYLAKQKLSKMS